MAKERCVADVLTESENILVSVMHRLPGCQQALVKQKDTHPEFQDFLLAR